MTPKVSVIVPIYNSEKYLRECLDSIANQTLSDIQVLMIDDGSTDSSAEICNEYAGKYPGFEYYYKDNGGTASARNVGLEHASGEYIGFVDSDDYIEPDMYEKMYNEAMSDNSDILFSIMPGLDDYTQLPLGVYNKAKIRTDIFPKVIPHVIDTGTFRMIDWGNCARLFKRNIITDNHIRMFEGSRRCEDFAFCVECTIHANSYKVIDEGELYHYRPNENSKSRSYSKNMWKSIRALMLYMREMTAKCTDYDFSAAMDYCVFYFSAQVCRNELRNSNRSEIKSKIAEVVHDSVCLETVNRITSKKMNSDYTAIYNHMKDQDEQGLYRYLKNRNCKKKHIVPITEKILKNKTVMRAYKLIRGK